MRGLSSARTTSLSRSAPPPYSSLTSDFLSAKERRALANVLPRATRGATLEATEIILPSNAGRSAIREAADER
jgi:hypothetical protein